MCSFFRFLFPSLSNFPFLLSTHLQPGGGVTPQHVVYLSLLMTLCAEHYIANTWPKWIWSIAFPCRYSRMSPRMSIAGVSILLLLAPFCLASQPLVRLIKCTGTWSNQVKRIMTPLLYSRTIFEVACRTTTFVLIGFVCWNSKNAGRLKLWALQSLNRQLDFVRFLCKILETLQLRQP